MNKELKVSSYDKGAVATSKRQFLFYKILGNKSLGSIRVCQRLEEQVGADTLTGVKK